MKNAFITGLIIGIFSGIWLFVMRGLGFYTTNMATDSFTAIDLASVVIPFVGLYFGVRAYKYNEMRGTISFLEALVQCFKTLIVGGIVAVFAAIVYINYFSKTNGLNFSDFSARMFGALIVGMLSALAVALIHMNKSKAI